MRQTLSDEPCVGASVLSRQIGCPVTVDTIFRTAETGLMVLILQEATRTRIRHDHPPIILRPKTNPCRHFFLEKHDVDPSPARHPSKAVGSIVNHS